MEPRLRAQRIEVRRPPEDAEALADGVRLEQVLVNLLGNAADALGGRDGGEVEVCVTSNPGRVTIAVRDNGPGIPTEVLPRLFEPFFTTKGPAAGSASASRSTKASCATSAGPCGAQPAGGRWRRVHRRAAGPAAEREITRA